MRVTRRTAQDGFGPVDGDDDGACECCPGSGCCWPEPLDGGGLKLGNPVGGVGAPFWGPYWGPAGPEPPADGPEE